VAELIAWRGDRRERFPILSDACVIGRGSGCQITLADPGVSREHCMLEARADGTFVKDLGSANQTLLNGKPVTEAVLQFGDRIEIGTTTLLFLPGASEDPDTSTRDREYEPTESIVLSPREMGVGSASDLLSRNTSQKKAGFYLDAMYNASMRIVSAGDASDLQDELLDFMQQTMSLPRCMVQLGTGDAASRTATGDDSSVFPSNEGIRKEVEQSGDAVLNRLQAAGGANAFSLYVPIRSGGSVLGLLYADTGDSSMVLDQLDLHLLGAIGHLAGMTLDRIESTAGIEQERRAYRSELLHQVELVGESPAIQAVRDQVQKIAPTETTALILGESGTGKEIVARLMHYHSPRRSGPMICVNCGAIPSELAESVLFGHVKGAFTGATANQQGQFEAAAGGTLFLDEIGELSPELQVKLLRVLEDGMFYPVGGTRAVRADCRVVAATHRDLERAIAEGSFREDLYYRINVVSIQIPPLRDRGDDLDLLLNHFLGEFSSHVGQRVEGIEKEARELLHGYHWPGNVRELRNAVERAVILSDDGMIGAEAFPFLVEGGTPVAEESLVSLRMLEKAHIEKVLRTCGGNKSKAARLLGIERSTLYDKIRDYEIPV
jgi:Nif-specific regulatory protein